MSEVEVTRRGFLEGLVGIAGALIVGSNVAEASATEELFNFADVRGNGYPIGGGENGIVNIYLGIGPIPSSKYINLIKGRSDFPGRSEELRPRTPSLKISGANPCPKYGGEQLLS